MTMIVNSPSFSQYKYGRILEVLDGQYERDTDPRNYAKYLLSMNEATSIKQCIKIYNKVYEKYCKLFDLGWSGHKNEDEDLARCLNENIIRILKKKNDTTYLDVLASLSNVRESPEIEDYQNEIIAYAKRIGVLDSITQSRVNMIIKAQKEYYEAMYSIHYDYLQPGTNGYKKAVNSIEDSMRVLKNNGYIECSSDFKQLVSNQTKIVFYILAILTIILLIYEFGGLFILALPIIGWYAIWKG